mgnify:CR=1 FL=1
MLAFLGYQPGSSGQALLALSATYALVPCAIKLLGGALLWIAPIDRRQDLAGLARYVLRGVVSDLAREVDGPAVNGGLRHARTGVQALNHSDSSLANPSQV